MFDKLPDLIDPIYSAQHHKQFVARVNQQRFPRLVEQLVTSNNDVDVDIKFYRHPQYKFVAFDMHLKSILNLRCQRSLASFEYQMDSSITGVFVNSMALAEDLPSDIEVYELPEEKLSLIELIEDEMLLNMPLSPIDEASKMAYENPEADDVVEDSENRKNPFAILKGLQKDPN